MKRFDTIESLTEVIGDSYFRDVPKGKIVFENNNMYEVILNKAVIMIIKEKKPKYILFDTNLEAKICFDSL